MDGRVASRLVKPVLCTGRRRGEQLSYNWLLLRNAAVLEARATSPASGTPCCWLDARVKGVEALVDRLKKVARMNPQDVPRKAIADGRQRHGAGRGAHPGWQGRRGAHHLRAAGVP
jgi:hypothetical protein